MFKQSQGQFNPCAFMRTTIAFVVAAMLLTGCRHPEPSHNLSETDLRQSMIGSWWSSNLWFGSTNSFITFYPDGQFIRSDAGRPIHFLNWGSWRIRDTAVVLTENYAGVPSDTFETYTIGSITDHAMVFSNPAESFQVKFIRKNAPGLLTAEQATVLSMKLANDKANNLYHLQPFQHRPMGIDMSSGSFEVLAEFISGHWVLKLTEQSPSRDTNSAPHWMVNYATVELAPDGSTNNVVVDQQDGSWLPVSPP